MQIASEEGGNLHEKTNPFFLNRKKEIFNQFTKRVPMVKKNWRNARNQTALQRKSIDSAPKRTSLNEKLVWLRGLRDFRDLLGESLLIRGLSTKNHRLE